jgi:hypothetical protein
MIENSPDARPQSGLGSAGIVFEAIAEGGITRFLALYMEAQPANIGPVRSVRPYYLDYLVPFDAAVAHAGGSPVALAEIKLNGIKDLDQFANAGAYRRENTRFAPHNLYTSTAGLDELQKSKAYTSSTFTSLVRRVPTPAEQPTATVINMNISSTLYNVVYNYDKATNTYKRSLGGQPHLEANDGAQLSPSVVVALVVPHSYGGIYSVYRERPTCFKMVLSRRSPGKKLVVTAS